jgi:DNA-directed RNA polymerase subunit M/transcription elongation factor TFIIS
MPLAERIQPRHDRNGPIGQRVGIVTCPNCQVEMLRLSSKRSGEDTLSEVVYRCPRCETETRRWIKL